MFRGRWRARPAMVMIGPALCALLTVTPISAVHKPCADSWIVPQEGLFGPSPLSRIIQLGLVSHPLSPASWWTDLSGWFTPRGSLIGTSEVAFTWCAVINALAAPLRIRLFQNCKRELQVNKIAVLSIGLKPKRRHRRELVSKFGI